MTGEITEPEVRWPELPLADWQETCTTLQLWTQVVGKIRLVLTPWPAITHSWHVVLYVTTRGLTTSPILVVNGASIDFDFIDHRLVMAVDDGRVRQLDLLKQRSVADFYSTVMAMLDDLACRSASIRCQTRFRARCASARMRSTPPMTPNTPIASGASCSPPTAS